MEKRIETKKRNELWEKFGGTCLRIRDAADLLELNVESTGQIVRDAYSCNYDLKEDKDELDEMDLYNHVLAELVINCQEQVEKLLKASKKLRELIGEPIQT